ncbi:hypothetical protein F0562_023518 [Nyssa sinensis]|uniref:Uncharacterized protein n=1 Tax=Nyssa sinensis TaxID=561372 RepID=A0A5J5BI63_9ASTE|nr:hypothetical protein F0562_023518 [Nyssa sinensis]
MEAYRRLKKNFLQRFFPSPPASPLPSALTPETEAIRHHHHHQQQQPQPRLAVGVVTPHNAHQNPDWPVLVIGFCFASAVAIALQSLQTNAPLPLTLHLLCLTMACAVAALFVAKNIASKLPEPAQVLEHVGALARGV